MPIGDAGGPHSFSTLFCEFGVILPHPFSIVTITSQLFSGHLSSSQFSQLFSTALKVVPSLPTSAQLFSPLPCSCQLFSTTHLCPPRLNSSQLFSTPLNSYHLFLSSSQLFSPSQLWPTLLDSSHLLSQICLHTEQAFPRRSIYIYPTLLYS